MVKHRKLSILVCLFLAICVLSSCSNNTSAEANPLPTEKIEQEATMQNDSTSIVGKVYTFDKDNNYQFSSSSDYSSSDSVATYGKFAITGTESVVTENGQSDGVPAYNISSGNISISYTYNDEALSASDDEWHLVDDGGTTIDVQKLEKSIQKGTIILQKSMDHLNWYNVSTINNAFINTPVQSGSLYVTQDIELINGCYYRLLVVYETARKIGTSSLLLVFPKDDYEYQRTAEVYEFYAAVENEHIEELEENTKRYSLGETVLVSNFASYSGEKEIGKGDLHYGWDLGNFFVSGFTSKTDSSDGVVFLKNVRDVVTLWFNLKQNINALNNDRSLTISADTDGHDQHFQTPATNFGRGMLIIRYTDSENVKHEPVMYYDYLLANTTFGTNTRVQLFEEGDYEVALDYEVTKSQLIPQTHHYRIFFKFSVRNANCMVYPFDVKTDAELTNSSVTENGFYLDLAKSRYLNIYIKKEVWTEGADGLTEDTRFNTTTKDGAQYVDEGIYTITAQNQYTGRETVKRIYVGTNRILAAYINSGYSLAKIQQLVESGAVIYEDGTIELTEEQKSTTSSASNETTTFSNYEIGDGANTTEDVPQKEEQSSNTMTREVSQDSTDSSSGTSTPIVIISVFASVGIALLLLLKKQKAKHSYEENGK